MAAPTGKGMWGVGVRYYKYWIPAIIWIIVIFSFSYQPAAQSSDLSRGFADFFYGIITFLLPALELSMSEFHSFIRKTAHFFIYLILGLLTNFSSKKSRVQKPALMAFIVCVIIATIDESFQEFRPGRSGEVSDVILDSAGSLTGIIIFNVGGLILTKKNSRGENNKEQNSSAGG